MKLSVSLPDDDVAFMDEYASEWGTPSRSSVLHEALQTLRSRELETEYEQAWDEWESSGEQELWDVTVADGLHASR